MFITLKGGMVKQREDNNDLAVSVATQKQPLLSWCESISDDFPCI